MKLSSFIFVTSIAAIVGGAYVESAKYAYASPTTESAMLTVRSLPDVDPADVECLAKNIYFESRGEPIQGQIAVAMVTINRKDHDYFPDSICEVVWQRKQFSWTHDGRSDVPKDKKAYVRAVHIAKAALRDYYDDPTDGALFFHTNYIKKPFWAKYMTVADQIGAHIFYHWDGSWS